MSIFHNCLRNGQCYAREVKKIAIVLTTLLLSTSAVMACPMEGNDSATAEKAKAKSDKPADKATSKTAEKAKTAAPSDKPTDKVAAPAPAPVKKPA